MLDGLKKDGFTLILTSAVFVGVLMLAIHIMILMMTTEILRKIHGLRNLRGKK